MFARYFVELPLPADRLERALLASPEAWLPGLAVEAHAHGERLLAEVGFGERVHVSRRVIVEVGRPLHRHTTTLLPIRWRPASAMGLIPELDGDLEVAALTPAASQLSISARYTPPLGSVGAAIDRALLHRVAEATLKDFLDRIAEALPALAAAEASAEATR
jgi:hypothetical protein